MSIIDELYNIEAKCFAAPFSAEDLGALLENRFTVILTERVGGETVGYAVGRVVADEGELFRIAVLPEFRRRGLAEKLLRGLHEKMRERGAAACFLEVRSKNAPAIALYEKFGYERLRVIPRYYPDDDGIAMSIIF